MKVFSKVILVIVLFFSSLAAQAKTTKQEYIDLWSEVAVQQMLDHGVPASITIAQGILESSYGNSMLAIKANNHFGIKCHSSWKGKEIYKDDDKKDECFRSYTSAYDSFDDHSLFLTSGKRYNFLFDLKRTNYKAWAKGLKKAGYATNPKYPHLLIKIIEDYNLSKLDKRGSYDAIVLETPNIETQSEEIIKEKEKLIVVNYNQHTVMFNKYKTKYVVTKKGDTYYRLAKEFSLNIRQLYRYNDVVARQDVLKPGTKVYVMSKKSRATDERELKLTHVKTLREISQEKGIKLKALLDYNNITSPDELLAQGVVINLRKN